jgi:hypothetical protein
MSFDFEKKYQEIRKHVIFAGNVGDIRINLNNRIKGGSVTVEYLQSEIVLEKENDNRSTVLKLLESAIRKLNKSNRPGE